MTASTWTALAVRNIAPRFPGFSVPSATRSSASAGSSSVSSVHRLGSKATRTSALPFRTTSRSNTAEEQLNERTPVGASMPSRWRPSTGAQPEAKARSTSRRPSTKQIPSFRRTDDFSRQRSMVLNFGFWVLSIYISRQFVWFCTLPPAKRLPLSSERPLGERCRPDLHSRRRPAVFLISWPIQPYR